MTLLDFHLPSCSRLDLLQLLRDDMISQEMYNLEIAKRDRKILCQGIMYSIVEWLNYMSYMQLRRRK
jgi:hypothetical protein